MTLGQLEHERLGQSRQRVIDRVADMTVVDAAAVGRGNELDDLPGVERPVDGLERARVRRPLLGDRMRDIAQGRADAVDPGQLGRLDRPLGCRLGAHAVGAFAVDDAPIDEPRKRAIEGRELLRGETIVGVVGVQEVEGVLEVDVVGVPPARLVEHLDVHIDNHYITLDRLRARGYITAVTDKAVQTG